ncbi:CU044_5270 family protein [Streptomyces sp. NPDC001985]|uniref:CU044_5270 family protein n=1 Tax=Streptomyces sp. NPDC001985 TaxID=3154406 RepID=UPI00331985DE
MDEMTRVRELRAHTPAPGRAVLTAGRRRLTEAIADDGRRTAPVRGRFGGRLRGLGSDWRLASLGAAAAITAAALLASHIGTDPAERDGSQQAAGPDLRDPVALLNRAAAVVRDQPAAPEPAPDQWIYTKQVLVDQPVLSSAGRPDSVEGDPEGWVRYAEPAAEKDASDGDRSAREIYRIAEALPDDPARAAAEARRLYPAADDREGRAETVSEHSFRALWRLIESYPLSSRARSKLFRALAAVPGITVGDRLVEDAARRPAIAVGLTGDGLAPGTRTEVLIDPNDYHYLGSRTVASRDHRTDPPTHMNQPSHRYAKGDVLYSEARTDAAVVDAEGQTP